jgi:hypothetical protein
VAFPGGTNAWQEIVQFNKVRNVLVHGGRTVGPKGEATGQAKVI